MIITYKNDFHIVYAGISFNRQYEQYELSAVFQVVILAPNEHKFPFHFSSNVFKIFCMISYHYCDKNKIKKLPFSAFFMVVFNRKITFGKNDWALLVCSFGIPAVPSVVFAVNGWFGPDGFW